MFISEEAHSMLDRSEVRSGDLLTTITGNVGRTILLDEDFGTGNINQHIARVRITDSRWISDLLFISFPNARPGVLPVDHDRTGLSPNQLKAGSGNGNPAPPLPEQRAIADALSDVDALIERLDALIAKKRAIKTATMQRLLTGQQRLPGFSAPWTTKRLGDISNVVAGQSPLSKHYNSRGLGLPLIQGNADISNRKSIDRSWTTHSPKTCLEGDLLLTVRAPVGHVAVAGQKSCLGRAFAVSLT